MHDGLKMARSSLVCADIPCYTRTAQFTFVSSPYELLRAYHRLAWSTRWPDAMTTVRNAQGMIMALCLADEVLVAQP
jgi:hypothetical protein